MNYQNKLEQRNVWLCESWRVPYSSCLSQQYKTKLISRIPSAVTCLRNRYHYLRRPWWKISEFHDTTDIERETVGNLQIQFPVMFKYLLIFSNDLFDSTLSVHIFTRFVKQCFLPSEKCIKLAIPNSILRRIFIWRDNRNV